MSGTTSILRHSITAILIIRDDHPLSSASFRLSQQAMLYFLSAGTRSYPQRQNGLSASEMYIGTSYEWFQRRGWWRAVAWSSKSLETNLRWKQNITDNTWNYSQNRFSFAARLEESDAREHKVPNDINYSAYWGHTIYKLRNKFYHLVLIQFTSTVLTNVITKLNNKFSLCLSTSKPELTILLTLCTYRAFCIIYCLDQQIHKILTTMSAS